MNSVASHTHTHTFPDIHSDILNLTSLDHWTTGHLNPSQSSHPTLFISKFAIIIIVSFLGCFKFIYFFVIIFF